MLSKHALGLDPRERLDIDVEHPVVPPAALARLTHGIDRPTAGPVAVRVGVEHGFQARLQIPADNLLRDTVSHRRNAQRTRAAARLGDVHRSHRWREVAPRGQPVPESVEVAGKTGLKLRNRLSVYASRPLVGLHLLEGFPALPLRDVERLCLGHAASPVTGCRLPRQDTAAPSAQPITGPSPLLRAAPPLCPASVLWLSRGPPAWP